MPLTKTAKTITNEDGTIKTSYFFNKNKSKLSIVLTCQKGCTMFCNGCTQRQSPYNRIVTKNELMEQVLNVFKDEDTKNAKKLNIYFSKWGEPSFNKNILNFVKEDLIDLIKNNSNIQTINPIISTIIPQNNPNIETFIYTCIYLKNKIYDGSMDVNFNIYSVNDEVRNERFSNLSMSLEEIQRLFYVIGNPNGRKYALVFNGDLFMKDDVAKIDKLFDKDKFIIKIVYSNFYEFKGTFDCFKEEFNRLGWDVIGEIKLNKECS